VQALILRNLRGVLRACSRSCRACDEPIPSAYPHNKLAARCLRASSTLLGAAACGHTAFCGALIPARHPPSAAFQKMCQPTTLAPLYERNTDTSSDPVLDDHHRRSSRSLRRYTVSDPLRAASRQRQPHRVLVTATFTLRSCRLFQLLERAPRTRARICDVAPACLVSTCRLCA
jgi:hypothetical protein